MCCIHTYVSLEQWIEHEQTECQELVKMIIDDCKEHHFPLTVAKPNYVHWFIARRKGYPTIIPKTIISRMVMMDSKTPPTFSEQDLEEMKTVAISIGFREI